MGCAASWDFGVLKVLLFPVYNSNPLSCKTPPALNPHGPHQIQVQIKLYLKLKQTQFVFKVFCVMESQAHKQYLQKYFPSHKPLSVSTLVLGKVWSWGEKLAVPSLWKMRNKTKTVANEDIWWFFGDFDIIIDFKCVVSKQFWWDLPSCLLYPFYSYLGCLLQRDLSNCFVLKLLSSFKDSWKV